MRQWRLFLAPSAREALKAIKDRKRQGEIAARIKALANDPRAGKPLEHPLDGLYSARASRDRYRILYEVDGEAQRINVIFIGNREPGSVDDVYSRAARLLERLLKARPGST